MASASLSFFSSMDLNYINKIKHEIIQFMENNFYSYSHTWLDECFVNYFKIQKNINPNLIKEFVIDSWKNADLRKIVTKSTLSHIEVDKKILNGIHCVQIEYAINIKISYYSQIKDPNLKTNKDRMFLFKLTDGISDIMAIENEKLPYFNTNCFTPGIKAILKGPILYVNKRLFLNARNIIIIGGQIEEYLLIYDSLVVLKRILCQDAENVCMEENIIPQSPKKQINSYLNTDNDIEAIYDDFDFNSDVQSLDYEEKQTSPSILLERNKIEKDKSNNNPLDDEEDTFFISCLDNLLSYEETSNQSLSCEKSNFDQNSPSNNMFSELSEFCDKNDNRQISKKDNIFIGRVKSVKILKKLTILNSRWSLSMILTDGKLCLPFIFSNNVLETIIGLKCKEFKEMKKVEDYQQKIKKLFEKIKRDLQDFDAIVSVQYTPDEEFPIVQEIIKNC